MTRADRMINSAPDYYAYSQVYTKVQQAIAGDFDLVDISDADLRLQLSIVTATWGLKYWEYQLGIPTVVADSYEIRRSRVLSKWRGFGNFSADLLKSVAEAYTNGTVDVMIDIPSLTVTIKFTSVYGTPPNIEDLKALVDNIIHAHLGVTYAYKYYTIAMVEAMTLDQLQTEPLNKFAPFV